MDTDWDLQNKKVLPVINCEGDSLNLDWEKGTPCHFYATFQFDKLEGIMPFHPEKSNSTVSFEKPCELDEASKPSLGNNM
jgi:hypothetical protein